MTGQAVARIDEAGVAPMRVGEGPAQPVGVGRHHDQVNMIGHQAIGDDLAIGASRRIAQQVAIKLIVAILEKGPLAPIAALGNVIGNAGKDETGKARHARTLPLIGEFVNCHGNSKFVNCHGNSNFNSLP